MSPINSMFSVVSAVISQQLIHESFLYFFLFLFLFFFLLD